MLRPVTTTLRNVQHKLKALLPRDAVLVGHSLNSDLVALKVSDVKRPPPSSGGGFDMRFILSAAHPQTRHRHLSVVQTGVWTEV